MRKLYILLAAALLTACGGGGGGGGTPSVTLTGVFLDSPVSGIHYQTSTQSGTTNDKGEFQYNKGETVTFSIGKIDLPSAVAAPIVTPLTLAGTNDISNQKVSNILVLLQSLDQDGDPANGITIPLPAAALASSAVNFDVPPDTFSNNSTVRTMLAGAGSANTSLITAQTAKANFTTTINSLGINVQPLANAGTTQSLLAGTTVTLDASNSSDANGDALTYEWTLATPPGSSSKLSSSVVVKPTFIADVVGDYVATLIVSDGKLSSTASTVTVTASVGNVAPVANTGQPQSITTGNTVTLDGSASSDVDGDPLTYSWSLTSKPTNSNATLTSTTVAKPSFTPDVAGVYSATLIVNDGKVNSKPATVQIAVANPSTSSVTLSASSVTAYQGDSITLSWSSKNATSCTASGGWSGTMASTGSSVIAPADQGVIVYTITCGTATGSSTVTVLSKYVAIPDPVFADALTRLGYPVTNGQMLTSDAIGIQRLCITSLNGMYGTPDQNGIAIFANTSVPDSGVKCAYTPSGKYISDITGLEAMLNIQSFRLEMQKFSSINISPLKKLTFISLWGEPLTFLDLSKNTALTSVGLSETSLKTVDLSKLTSVVELALQNTDATAATLPYTIANGTTVYGFSTLDVSNNVNLQRLYVKNNGLTTLDLSKNKVFRELWAADNNIKTIDLSNNPAVDYVIVSNNNLTTLNVTGIAGGGVASHFYTEKNPNLTKILVTNPIAWTAAAAATVSAWNAGLAANPAVSIDSQTKFVSGP